MTAQAADENRLERAAHGSASAVAALEAVDVATADDWLQSQRGRSLTLDA